MKRILIALALATATPAAAEQPNPQLALQVSGKLERYGISVPPEALTLAQAAALHNVLVNRDSYLETRRRVRAILRNPDYRD